MYSKRLIQYLIQYQNLGLIRNNTNNLLHLILIQSSSLQFIQLQHIKAVHWKCGLIQVNSPKLIQD